MSFSVLMTYDKTIYMIKYLVSFGTREISYLFNRNIIKAKIHLNILLSKYIFDSFKTSEKSISRTDIFTNLVGKNFFQPEKFSKTPTSVPN